MSLVARSITGVLLGLILIMLTCLLLGSSLRGIFHLMLLKIFISPVVITRDFVASSAALPARLAPPGERKHGRSVHLIATLFLSSGMGLGEGFPPPNPCPAASVCFWQAERAGLKDRYPKGRDSSLAR